MARVQSSSAASSVNIKDTAGNELTSTGGALDVNVVGAGTAGTPISVYNEITSLVISGTATVLTYTVPVGKTLNLTRVLASSDSVGSLELDINGSANAKGRVTYGNFNLVFNYINQENGYEVAAGTIITIIATNASQLGAASFNATLQGVLN